MLLDQGQFVVATALAGLALLQTYRIYNLEKDLEKERVKRNDERAGRTKAERELTEKEDTEHL